MDWFKIFVQIMNDELVAQLQKRLKAIVKDDVFSEESISVILLDWHSKQVQWNKKRTRMEFCVDAHISSFQNKDSMLDLGSDVNIFPRKTWEALGKTKLVFSPFNCEWKINIVFFLLVD